MEFARNIASGIAVAALIAVAGCATTTASRPAGLSQSAENLDMSARAMAARSDTIGPPYQADAHEFARQAHEFRSLVDTSTVSHEDVQAQYERLSQSYHQVRQDAEHANIQQARGDMEPVTAAYHDVAHDMGGAPRAEAGD